MSYILTNLITTLTDVMAARIPHSRERPVITRTDGETVWMQIQTCPKFGGCVCVYVLGLTHREVAELSGIERKEKDTNAPFTRTLKQAPDLHSFGRAQHHWAFWLSNLLYFLKQAAEHFQMASFKREAG